MFWVLWDSVGIRGAFVRCLTVRCAEGSPTLSFLRCYEIVAEFGVHLWMFDDLFHRRKPDLGGLCESWDISGMRGTFVDV